MRILLSNDDGVNAKGILVLAEELRKIAEVVVIAPDRNRSGASNSLSVQVPVRIYELDDGRFSVTGTPTDCVHLALTGYFDTKFDIVVSGINHGANMGDDILYSGTVAAATEGRMLGMPSVAVSLAAKEGKWMNFSAAATITRQLVEKLHTHTLTLPVGTILNLNVPDVPLEEIRGMEITRLGKRHVAEPAVKELDPRGYAVYWVGASGLEADAGEGTDFNAIREKKVSITPLQVDMTNYNAFEKISEWLIK